MLRELQKLTEPSEAVALIAFLAASWAVGLLVQRELSRRYSVSDVVVTAIKTLSVGLGAVAGLLAILVHSPPLVYFTLAMTLLLIGSSLYDLKTLILPDMLTFAIAALGIIVVLFFKSDVWLDSVLGAVIGFGLLLLIERIYLRMRGHAGLGRGDAKLLGAIGIWTGALALPYVLLVASGGALVFVLLSALIERRSINQTTPIAFGPWIAFGGWSVWLIHPFLF